MKLSLISEGYGRTFDMDGTYLGYNEDPTPKVLSLGKWNSPRGNKLLAGINLHYLSPDQTTRLQRNLGSILKDRNLRRRVRKLRSLVPDIFDRAYRTYDTKKINGQVSKGTLKFIQPKDYIRQAREKLRKDKNIAPEIDKEAGSEPDLDVGGATPQVSNRIKQRHDRIQSKPDDTKELKDQETLDDGFEDTVQDVENKEKRRARGPDGEEEKMELSDDEVDELIPDVDAEDEEDVELDQ